MQVDWSEFGTRLYRSESNERFRIMSSVVVNTTLKGDEYEEEIYNILLEAGYDVKWCGG